MTEADVGEPATSNLWDASVSACTPENEPRADDIPTLGAATFRADRVAVADGSSGSTAAEAPKLYARKIEFVASFSNPHLTGTITEPKDEDGRVLEAACSDSFRKETVGSIALPAAEASGDAEGFFEVEAGSATVSFARNLRSESATSTVRVQLVDEASEALGIWTATDTGPELNLEGSFGAMVSQGATSKLADARRDFVRSGSEGFLHLKSLLDAVGSRSASDDRWSECASINMQLNHCELVAVAVGSGAPDDQMYGTASQPLYVQAWNRAKEYIRHTRAVRALPSMFEHFETLAKQWTDWHYCRVALSMGRKLTGLEDQVRNSGIWFYTGGTSWPSKKSSKRTGASLATRNGWPGTTGSTSWSRTTR